MGIPKLRIEEVQILDHISLLIMEGGLIKEVQIIKFGENRGRLS